ncbi:MAG: LON peptidase substrate-binding domain-containing protein [Woeseia sp.]|nr:LON peptidase substrate-binding domain-containing protein [Woeseia sp.]
MRIPLFPLQTVLYPGGPLPLRIFEARYLDMVSSCLRDESPFGIVQIRRGSETGASEIWSVGTLATISDWYQGSDGILGITALGDRRFRVISKEQGDDGLLHGNVELLPIVEPFALPEEYLPLVQILDGVMNDLGALYEDLPRQYDDAVWLGYRFAEILPFTPEQKQDCLEIDDPLKRLQLIRSALRDVRGINPS